MSAVYLESSALLAWLFGEARADEVKQALDDAAAVVISELTILEAHRALLRAEGRSALAEADAQVPVHGPGHDDLVDEEELEFFTYEMAKGIASNSPLSIAVIKEQLNIMGGARPINSEFYEKID